MVAQFRVRIIFGNVFGAIFYCVNIIIAFLFLDILFFQLTVEPRRIILNVFCKIFGKIYRYFIYYFLAVDLGRAIPFANAAINGNVYAVSDRHLAVFPDYFILGVEFVDRTGIVRYDRLRVVREYFYFRSVYCGGDGNDAFIVGNGTFILYIRKVVLLGFGGVIVKFGFVGGVISCHALFRAFQKRVAFFDEVVGYPFCRGDLFFRSAFDGGIIVFYCGNSSFEIVAINVIEFCGILVLRFIDDL